MKEKLIEFINGNERSISILGNDGYYYIFMVQKYRENTMILYMQKTYIRNNQNLRPSMDESFEFAGIYNKKDDKFYLTSYGLRKLLKEEDEGKDFELSFLIIQRIQEIVGNDYNNIKDYINEDSSFKNSIDKYITDLEKDTKYQEAKSEFLRGVKPEEIVYKPYLPETNITKENLVDYLEDGEEFIDKMAKDYISKNKDSIKLSLLKNEKIKMTLTNLYNMPEHPIHLTKKLKDALKSGDYKTVNVTIKKNEVEFTFKTGIRSLMVDQTDSYYSTYDIVAPDRASFEKIYGKHEGYTISDIEKVTYGKKVIYVK